MSEREIKQLISLLRRAAEFAYKCDAHLGNGAEIGSLVGAMADELEISR